MRFEFTESEQRFRREVRAWYMRNTPNRWYEINMAEWETNIEGLEIALDFQRKLGAKGWYQPALPREFGGISANTMQQVILNQERATLDAPVTHDQASGMFVAHTIMLYGTAEQKRRYVPSIARAEAIYCLGYSEPAAGSDLAGLQTTAIEDGADFVVTGQKIFTSRAHRSDFCFLGARTDPSAPKHKGISMFIVDMKTPGITVRPLINMVDGHDFNEVFFHEARVPRANLLGEKNQGWKYLATALNFERSGIGGAATWLRLTEEIKEHARKTKRESKPLTTDPIIRNKIANLVVSSRVAHLLCYRTAWLQSQGKIPSHEASIGKVFSGQLGRDVATTGMEILGLYGQITKKSHRSQHATQGHIQHAYPSTIVHGIGGGSNEVMRTLIATLGLGLPR